MENEPNTTELQPASGLRVGSFPQREDVSSWWLWNLRCPTPYLAVPHHLHEPAFFMVECDRGFGCGLIPDKGTASFQHPYSARNPICRTEPPPQLFYELEPKRTASNHTESNGDGGL